MNTLFEIEKIILATNPLANDHSEMMEIISSLDGEDKECLLKLFLEEPIWVKKISMLIKTKKRLFASGNTIDWERLIEEEEKEILKLV